MSVIFQTTPPSVYVHELPRDAHFFSYKVEDVLKINAWMPDGYKTIHQDITMSNDVFYEEYCEGCPRNCYYYLREKYYDDDSDEVDWSLVPGGEANHCYVYDEGYTGQDCPEGNSMEDDTINFTIADMVFQVGLEYSNKRCLFTVSADKAYLRSGIIEDNEVYATEVLMASNVFGDLSDIGNICWGDNSTPHDLRSIVSTYSSSLFNNDLLPLEKFEANCEEIRISKSLDNYEIVPNENFLCYGDDADAVILLHAESNIPAFFTLLSAGFKPIEGSEFLMIIPAKQVQLEKDGAVYHGYETIPDAVGKRWFVSENSLLIGQI